MSESIQENLVAAAEATTLRAEVVSQAEEGLSATAAGIPVTDKETMEIDREVDEQLAKLRDVDIYSDDGDVTAAFQQIFSSSQQRRNETREISSALSRRNYKGKADSEEFKAVNELRDALEEYDPSKFALTSTERFLGFIPMPGMLKKKLKSYARQMQTAESHINEIMAGVEATREDSVRATKELSQLDTSFLKLAKSLRIQHAKYKRLDERLHEYLDELKERDPMKAQKISDELIFKVKQERLDTVTVLNHAVLGSQQVGLLKQTQEMVKTSCDRLATNGRLIFEINQSVAATASDQARSEALITSANQTLNNMTEGTAKQIREHTEKMRALTENPITAVESLKKAFEDTRAAMTDLENHQKNAALRAQTSIDAMELSLKQADDRVASEKAALAALGSVVNKISDRGMAPPGAGPKPPAPTH